MFSKETNRIIDLLAEKAVRRIQREGLKVHAFAIRSSQDALDGHTCSAVAAQELHNRVNDTLVSLGILRRECNWLVAA